MNPLQTKNKHVDSLRITSSPSSPSAMFSKLQLNVCVLQQRRRRRRPEDGFVTSVSRTDTFVAVTSLPAPEPFHDERVRRRWL